MCDIVIVIFCYNMKEDMENPDEKNNFEQFEEAFTNEIKMMKVLILSRNLPINVWPNVIKKKNIL